MQVKAGKAKGAGQKERNKEIFHSSLKFLIRFRIRELLFGAAWMGTKPSQMLSRFESLDCLVAEKSRAAHYKLTLGFSSRTIQPMTENPDDRLKLIFGRRSISQYAPGEV